MTPSDADPRKPALRPWGGRVEVGPLIGDESSGVGLALVEEDSVFPVSDHVGASCRTWLCRSLPFPSLQSHSFGRSEALFRGLAKTC